MSTSVVPTQTQIENKIKIYIHPGADIEPWTSALIGKYLYIANKYKITIDLSKLVGKTSISTDKEYYIMCYQCQREAEKVEEGKRKAGLK